MNKVAAVLDQIEAQQQMTAIPDDIPLMELADRVVRGKIKLTPPQQRMLIELLPYIAPKLTAVAVGHLEGSFADLLDKAIARSHAPKVIEAKPVPAPIQTEQQIPPGSPCRSCGGSKISITAKPPATRKTGGLAFSPYDVGLGRTLSGDRTDKRSGPTTEA